MSQRAGLTGRQDAVNDDRSIEIGNGIGGKPRSLAGVGRIDEYRCRHRSHAPGHWADYLVVVLASCRSSRLSTLPLAFFGNSE